MKITYPNGTVVEALVLSRGKDSLRAAVPGEEDARSFTLANDAWISEECEPVKIEFAWERHGVPEVPAEADCICSKELASHLLSLLATDSSREEVLENMLSVFSADGQRVRIQQRPLSIAGAGSFGSHATKLERGTV